MDRPVRKSVHASTDSVGIGGPLASSRSGEKGTRRQWVLLVTVLLSIGIGGAIASIWFRRTRLEQTSRFWGMPTIRALQSSAEFRLHVPQDSSLRSKTKVMDDQGVDLANLPGVAHLRHALLDDRHFDWSTLSEDPIERVIGRLPSQEWVTIQLQGTPRTLPADRPIQPVTLKIELSEGWVGSTSHPGSVRMTNRVLTAMRYNLLKFSKIRSMPLGMH